MRNKHSFVLRTCTSIWLCRITLLLASLPDVPFCVFQSMTIQDWHTFPTQHGILMSDVKCQINIRQFLQFSKLQFALFHLVYISNIQIYVKVPYHHFD